MYQLCTVLGTVFHSKDWRQHLDYKYLDLPFWKLFPSAIYWLFDTAQMHCIVLRAGNYHTWLYGEMNRPFIYKKRLCSIKSQRLVFRNPYRVRMVKSGRPVCSQANIQSSILWTLGLVAILAPFDAGNTSRESQTLVTACKLNMASCHLNTGTPLSIFEKSSTVNEEALPCVSVMIWETGVSFWCHFKGFSMMQWHSKLSSH